MKELINNHIRGIKGFAEEYGIPYNTVRQWANGTRNAPKWLVKLFKQNCYQVNIFEVITRKKFPKIAKYIDKCIKNA